MAVNSKIRLLVTGLALLLPIGPARPEVVVVVSPESAVRTLNEKQVADLFLGNASRFPDGSMAVPIDRAENSAGRAEFYKRFANWSLAQVKMHWAKLIFTGRGQPPRNASDASDVKALLARNPDAISYIDRSEVDGTVVIVAIHNSER